MSKMFPSPNQQPSRTEAKLANFGMLAKRISDFKTNIRKFQSQNLLLEIGEEEDESENEDPTSGKLKEQKTSKVSAFRFGGAANHQSITPDSKFLSA